MYFTSDPHIAPAPEADDDLTVAFEDTYGTGGPLTCDTETIRAGYPFVKCRWQAEVLNAVGQQLFAVNFDTRQALLDYLAVHRVRLLGPPPIGKEPPPHV